MGPLTQLVRALSGTTRPLPPHLSPKPAPLELQGNTQPVFTQKRQQGPEATQPARQSSLTSGKMAGGGPFIIQLLTRSLDGGRQGKGVQIKGHKEARDFPGSPVDKTLCFTAGGKGSNSGRATEIPHAAQHKTATKRWTLVKTSPQRWLTCSLLSTFFSLGSGTGFSGGTVSRSLQTFAWERRQERAVINLHLGQKEPDHLGFLRASVASLAMGMMAQITQGTLGKDQLAPGPAQALPTFLFMFYAFLL